jgi:hypothetical protein
MIALIAPGSTHGRRTIARSVPTPKEGPTQERSDGRADDDDDRRGEKREEKRVLQRHTEILAGDDVLIVLQRDEWLAGEEERHLMQACP